MGVVALEQVQIGKESVFGTEVDATARWMGLEADSRFIPHIVNVQTRTLRGNYAPTHKATQTFVGGKLQLNGFFSFDDFLYVPLCSMVGGVTPAAGPPKVWTFAAPYTAAFTTAESRTIEATDGTDPWTFSGCTCDSWTLSGNNAEDGLVKFQSTWTAKGIAQKAITSSLADRVVEYLPGLKMKLYADDLGGTVGTTELAISLIDWSVRYSSVEQARRAMGSLSTSKIRTNVPDITIDLTVEATSGVKGELTKYLANTGRLIQLIGQGTSANAILCIQAAGDWQGDPSLWDADNNDTTLKLQLKPREDIGAFAGYFKLIITNLLASVVG